MGARLLYMFAKRIFDPNWTGERRQGYKRLEAGLPDRNEEKKAQNGSKIAVSVGYGPLLIYGKQWGKSFRVRQKERKG